jgi:hypothetical protein
MEKSNFFRILGLQFDVHFNGFLAQASPSSREGTERERERKREREKKK